jgi:hypothetical protein
VKTLRPSGGRVSTQFLVFPISTRVDITIYQHGKCFLFVKYFIWTLKLTKMRIFARKIGLLSSKWFSGTEKSSYDCAEYKIEGETYKTTSKSNLKFLLRR